MKFLVNILLDSMWGFVFVCWGTAFITSSLHLPLNQFISPQNAAWLLGSTVVLALLLRLPIWLLLWLEKEKVNKQS